MIQIKKTILTLVALLAVTTGAWAQEETLLTTITATGTEQASYSTANVATVSFSNLPDNSSSYIANWGWWGYGWSATVNAAEGYTITKCIFYDDANRTATDSEAPFVVETTEDDKTPKVNGTPILAYQSKGIKKIEVYGYVTPSASSASAVEVAWNKASKIGSFTMPGGNVELEPEYYPQATVADGGVTAADADARATTDDPLVKVDATKLTGAKKLMYFVSNSGTTAPAYDAEGWTDQLPTAEGFTQQGIVYVWYYPVGTDEGVDGATATYSDGDICLQSITARIAAAPTYAVTFADDLAEPTLWTASPNTGVTKGQTVTVTYSGTKKVLGVKAEKKASTVPVTAITLNKTATTIYKLNDNSTETLSVTAVTPDEATDKTYTWSSDDITKATVDQNGVVTAVAEGTAHIRATANDGSGVYGECTVTVTDLSAYYSKMVECGCDNLDGKCANGANPMSPFTGQVLSADQAIALAKAKAAETSSNCAVFYDNGEMGKVAFAKNDGTTGSARFYYDAGDKGLTGYRGYYVSK